MFTTSPCVLQTPDIDVLVLPREGARIASFRSRQTHTEFLMQSRGQQKIADRGWYAKFQQGPSAGIDECVPTVGACGEDTKGGAVPDHGDFWQTTWEVLECTGTTLSVEALGFSRPLRFRKEISVAERTLSIRYELSNIGDTDLSLLYACHPLFAVDSGDRICLPYEVSELSLYYSRNERLGPRGRKVSWPTPTRDIALDRVMPESTGFAEMLYTDRLHQGSCGIYRSATQQGVHVRFDSARLPYLGLWLCYGGWPDEAEYSRQYAVALEPTLAPVNTLKEAQDAGQATWLRPAETLRWIIDFEITEQGISLDHFRSLLSSGARSLPAVD